MNVINLSVFLLNIAENGLELLETAVQTWNDYYTKIVSVLTTSPETAYPGVWSAMETINEYLSVVGVALCVICFYISLMKNTMDFRELKRPEKVFGVLLRLIISMSFITISFDMGLQVLKIFQACITKLSSLFEISPSSGQIASIPKEIYTLAAQSGTGEGLGVYILSLLGCIAVFLLSIMLLMIVYLRFIKIYLYAAVSPIPLAFAAGETTERTSRNFILSYISICFQGIIIGISFIIFSKFISAGYVPNPNESAGLSVIKYIGTILVQLLVLVSVVKASDRISKDMIGG